jgi:hypothetical protein
MKRERKIEFDRLSVYLLQIHPEMPVRKQTAVGALMRSSSQIKGRNPNASVHKRNGVVAEACDVVLIRLLEQ